MATTTTMSKRVELAKHCSSRNWSKAIRVLDSVLAKHSSILDICNRAFCYNQLELYKHVIKDCDKALELQPCVIQAYLLKGFLSSIGSMIIAVIMIPKALLGLILIEQMGRRPLLLQGGGEPMKGALGGAIDTHFGSLEGLVKKMSAEGAALQGSGWVWLGLDKELKKLVVDTTANQDPLVRPEYLKNVWKVINWKYASEVYDKESK